MSRVRRAPVARIALAALAVIALSACAGDETDELRAWMQEVRNTTQPVRTTIPAPKVFEPFRYANEKQVDPFSTSKLAVALQLAAERPRNGVAPDFKRRREALESYPLDQIRMVGNLSNRRSKYALLQVDNMVYQARVGHHAGQNFGVITQITDNEITLRELVQDAAGDWVERETSLRLQESKQ